MADNSVSSRQATATSLLVNSFIRSVYNWMAVGLALTGGIAYFTAHNEVMQGLIFGNPMIFFILIAVELGMVFYLSARIHKMEASTATALFVAYAGLNGVTLSFIFLAYTKTSIASVFFICSATFIACSIYGMTTKKDLTSWGSFLFMGLIGIVIASLVNIFVQSTAIFTIVSYVGVIIFIGLTAYDTQKLKNMALSQPGDLEAGVIRKGAIRGALSLYLDFINLFLMLLHILGQRE